MKKKILFIITIFIGFLIGCDISNNPTSKVEELLSKYQMFDREISESTSYLELTNGVQLEENLQDRYAKLIKNQYKNLSYEIKEEEIDGNNATVTVQIKVTDYNSVFQKNSQTNESDADYYQNIVEKLESSKEKITYTIDFKVVKDGKGDWKVANLDREEKAKLLGMYS